MRLSSHEIDVIKQTFLDIDSDVVVYLFGSRVDDMARGGDIDLLVISQCISFEDKIKARVKLYQHLGEQKIDIVIAKSLDETAFVRHAVETGVQL